MLKICPQDISSCFSLSEGPFSVHRLDKVRTRHSPLACADASAQSTTGCLALALNPQTARSLSKQFQEGTVKKTYLALVRGGASTFQEQFGTIDGRLKYKDGRGKVHASGKEAKTEWEVLASSVCFHLCDTDWFSTLCRKSALSPFSSCTLSRETSIS